VRRVWKIRYELLPEEGTKAFREKFIMIRETVREGPGLAYVTWSVVKRLQKKQVDPVAVSISIRSVRRPNRLDG
jgi:hypothetical protein